MEEKKVKDDSKNSKKKLLIMIGIIVFLVVIGGIIYATLIRDDCNENNTNNTNTNNNSPFHTDVRATTIDKKPIIYLYPTEETEVNVILENPEKLTHTYPKYLNSWNVLAKPNGDLKDLETGRNLYALYWEGVNSVKPNMSEGFVVKGEETITFLEEKLALLGLTEREANEFIIYWLPQLENNKYNFIRFQTMQEINSNMPLKVTPLPDTIIRVMMEFKVLDKYMEISEQILETPTRNGFTVVEWGGTEIR